MKLMAMHKVDAAMEAGALPSAEVIQGIGALIGEMLKQNVFVAGEGLKPSATRARVSVRGTQRHVEKGPYAGRHELIAGFCLLRAATFDEAVDWSARLAQSLGDGVEVEVGPVVEPWDLGEPPPKTKPPPRFLALAKSDAKAEAGQPFLPRIAAPLDEMKRAGALITAQGLTPSAQGKRVVQQRDRQKVLDGPFTESKELIAGFSLLDVPSWDEALRWMERFAAALGGEVELDLRPL